MKFKQYLRKTGSGHFDNMKVPELKKAYEDWAKAESKRLDGPDEDQSQQKKTDKLWDVYAELLKKHKEKE